MMNPTPSPFSNNINNNNSHIIPSSLIYLHFCPIFISSTQSQPHISSSNPFSLQLACIIINIHNSYPPKRTRTKTKEFHLDPKTFLILLFCTSRHVHHHRSSHHLLPTSRECLGNHGPGGRELIRRPTPQPHP